MKSLVVLLAFLFGIEAFAQPTDTVFRHGKVLLRSTIVVTLDSAEWQQRQQSALPSFPRKLTNNRHGELRTVNNCGVAASFTPAGDSTFAGGILCTFTNTSTNATSIQWLVNGFSYGSGQTLPMSFSEVGLQEVKLVAKNGGCTDTSVVYYLNTGVNPATPRKTLVNNYGLPQTDEYSTCMDHVQGGGFLLAGYSSGWPDQLGERGLVMKIKESGCVEWTKLFDGEYAGRIGGIRALRDSGFLVSVAGYQKTTVLRFDRNGQVLWKRSYANNAINLFFTRLFEAADGSLFVAGAEGFNGLYLAKLTAAGDAIWCKYYLKKVSAMIGPVGITELGQHIFVSGYLDNPNQEVAYNSEYNKDGFILSVDRTNGNTAWAKMFGAVGVDDFFQDIHAYGDKLLVNDVRTNYLGGTVARQAFHFIDTTGQVLQSKLVLPTEPLQVPFICNIVPLANNKLYLTQGAYQPLSLQPGYVYRSYWQKIDTSGLINWQAGAGSISRQRFWYSTKGNNESLASLGDQPNLLVQAFFQSDNFLFARIDSAGPDFASSCMFQQANVSIIPDQILGFPITWIKDTVVALQVLEAVRVPGAVYSQMRYQCPDYVDSCAYVRVTGSKKLCNLAQTYTYHASKTKGCSLPVDWRFSAGVQLVSSTATDVTVQFSNFGQHTIYAYLNNSCNPVVDSIRINAALPGNAALNLGADTSLCPGNTITLQAGNNFLNYRWQDNSGASTFLVSVPGKYWVTVTDSCGNLVSDTITLSPASAVPISIGPDRTKCNSDTLHLNAPAGFLNYTWSNNYNINSTTSQNVVVNPSADTAYYIKAEKTPGCFAFDTVRITVYHSPPIDLGADKSFCLGDSAMFDAGAGFQTYTWSSGQSNQLIVVKTAGGYSVVGTTAQGCKSADTVKVLNVYSLPSVSLDKKTALCFGESKTLNAGNFASYSWSTGENTAAIVVNAPGQYAVIVADANGCKGSDTTAITTINPLPAGFLPADTAICSYGSVQLKPLASFSRYSWSTGDVDASITVSKPGLYWLDVVDANACKGRDTITVNPKDCLSGFYAPSAFTPNGDGRNDRFQPLLFGKVKAYRFSVYNRWGQIIFETTDLQKGWDGRVGGIPQQTGVFVWTCTYQLEGEVQKTEKGSVALMR